MICNFHSWVAWGIPFSVFTSLLLQCSAREPADNSTTQGIEFDAFFTDQALRLELYHYGNTAKSAMSLHEIYEEPTWPENRRSVISPFPYGKCRARVIDQDSNTLICTRPFDTMFSEYATTEPARKGIQRVFETTVRIPKPRKTARVILESRSANQVYEPVLEFLVDPKDYHIRKESTQSTDQVIGVLDSGKPENCVDIVFLAEGYTIDESSKFESDIRKFIDFMFAQRPYAKWKNQFNIRGVFRASQEKGPDEPRQGIFRHSALNATYNIFDVDRYMLVEENHAMHRMAAQVPYDTIVVLVNTKRYGGGAICLDYCVSSADHPTSPMVFLHEFGHSFAYLADEYVGNVAYSDMYPEGIEPVEPNITRELNRDKMKWKKHLSGDLPIPSQLLPKDEAKQKQIVGAFEGGGYMAKGIFRPEQSCWMGSNDRDEGFCVVCVEAIEKMIQHYVAGDN